jgi:hypothetical protein
MPVGANDREILERTVQAIADRARDAYRLVEEAHEVDPRDDSGLVAAAKRLRLELLQTKGELRAGAQTAPVALSAVQPAGALGTRGRS